MKKLIFAVLAGASSMTLATAGQAQTHHVGEVDLVPVFVPGLTKDNWHETVSAVARGAHSGHDYGLTFWGEAQLGSATYGGNNELHLFHEHVATDASVTDNRHAVIGGIAYDTGAVKFGLGGAVAAGTADIGTARAQLDHRGSSLGGFVSAGDHHGGPFATLALAHEWGRWDGLAAEAVDSRAWGAEAEAGYRFAGAHHVTYDAAIALSWADSELDAFHGTHFDYEGGGDGWRGALILAMRQDGDGGLFATAKLNRELADGSRLVVDGHGTTEVMTHGAARGTWGDLEVGIALGGFDLSGYVSAGEVNGAGLRLKTAF